MSRVVLVTSMLAGVVTTTILAYGNQPDARPLDVLAYGLMAAMAGGLWWLDRRPEIALAIALGATAVFFARGYAYSLWAAPALVAAFVTISNGRRTAGWVGYGALVLAPAAGTAFAPEPGNLAGLAIWTLGVVGLGQLAEISRARRAYTAEVEKRMAEAERGREEEALRRAQEERFKIARELHDVTSHTVSLIALHAGVAADAVERAGGPEEARVALDVVRTASREALVEMKGVLSVLREDAGRASPPGAGQLRELAGSAGLPVAFDTVGVRRALPPAVDLTVYRVVQEALTNTVRHAAATRAAVTLRYETGGVLVRIEDDGRGCQEPPGHGLTGMRERVAAVGGRLDLGDRPAGGFQVVAWLPA
ncbi:sensor histidine kinase [Actinomadura sp. 9N407]|uniref:sensor histidine kinase n=1 Tax=Actinomadura sp. 9N407 TaxID=3375154 RepID=UPI0037AC3730